MGLSFLCVEAIKISVSVLLENSFLKYVCVLPLGDNHGATKQACIQIQSWNNQKERIAVLRQAMQVGADGMGRWVAGKMWTPAG